MKYVLLALVPVAILITVIIAWWPRRKPKGEFDPIAHELEATALDAELREIGKRRQAEGEFGTPEDLDDGARYDARSGAIIYKDSISIVPYIGSEQEAIDAERGLIPKPPKSNEGDWPTSSCSTCLGHGRLNFGTGPVCPNCHGVGSVPARRFLDR